MFGISCKPGCRSSIPGRIDLTTWGPGAEANALNSLEAPQIFWEFDEAQDELEELIDLALAGEPQRVRIGDETVVVLSEETYKLLSRRKPALEERLLNVPDLSDLDLSRNQSPSREFEW